MSLAATAMAVTGLSVRGTLIGVAVLAVAGLLFGLWKRRIPPESQGVIWYGRHLLPSAAAVGFALALWDPSSTNEQVAKTTVAVSLVLIAARGLLWSAIGSARRHGKGLRPVLVVGPSHRLDQVKHRLLTYPEAGLRFEASYAPIPGWDRSPESGRTLVDSLLATNRAEHVICIADEAEEPLFMDFVRFASGKVDISLIMPMASLCAGQVRASIGDLGVVPLRLRSSWGSAGAKRAFDIFGSAIGLILLAPVLIITALAVKLGDGGPAIFKQRRVGRDGQLFTMYKFRSMVLDAETLKGTLGPQSVNFGLLFKLHRDPRVTRVGSFIRRFSIDELPQLFNVLRGEMSLVGPRPLPVEPDEFDIRAQIRHRALPGITGLWQVLGANALSYTDMLDLDLAYVATASFGVDFLTLLRTAPALVIRRSAY